MNLRFPIRSVMAASVAAGLLAAASEAEAHARLVRATPAANSTVAAPRLVTLYFSETLVPKFSSFDMMTADGGKVAVAASVPPKNRKSVVGVVVRPAEARRLYGHVACGGGRRRPPDQGRLQLHRPLTTPC